MNILLHIFIALFFVPATQETSSGQSLISADERNALIALYRTTGGKGWTQQYGWVGPIGSECTWYGVRCARENSRLGSGPLVVTELDLKNNRLAGEIPLDLGNLRNLSSLILAGNDIKGSLPDALLEKFDQGQMDIQPTSLVHDINEINVEIKSVSLRCFGVKASFSADGSVGRERKMCRKEGGREIGEPYLESQRGKTYYFDRFARSLIRSGFFSNTPSTRGQWIDVGEIIVTARRMGGDIRSRSWSKPVSMREWELQMQIYGIIEQVQWIGTAEIKK